MQGIFYYLLENNELPYRAWIGFAMNWTFGSWIAFGIKIKRAIQFMKSKISNHEAVRLQFMTACRQFIILSSCNHQGFRGFLFWSTLCLVQVWCKLTWHRCERWKGIYKQLLLWYNNQNEASRQACLSASECRLLHERFAISKTECVAPPRKRCSS